MKAGWIVVASLIALWSTAASAQAPGEPDLEHPQNTNAGIFAFTGHCASCHDAARNGAENRAELVRHTPESVLESVTSGRMAPYAAGLSEFDRRALAVYVGGRPFGAAESGDASRMKNACTARPPLEPFRGSEWNGWGFDSADTRFQTAPGITPADVPNLVLKWAFGFPSGNSAYGQPSVVGGRVFVGADTGFVYAIDAATGCVYWSFRADAGVRTAVTVGPGSGDHRYIAYFGDIRANVYAIDAETAQLVWRDRLDPHPVARITGTPKLVEGRLYVPLSSLEESGAGNPNYPCCTFRGGVAAYDARSGKQFWKAYTIAEKPTPVKKTSKGTQLWAPAGAGVWSSPTVDVKRRAVYVATGNGYTEPAARGSDSVIAFAMDTGKLLWANQVMAGDAYVRDCPGIYRPNVPKENKSETCPEDLGPDMDFGNAPILRHRPNGPDVIVIGQKDGHVWALDPDREGKVLWNRQVALGLDPGNPGTGGAVMWGSASDERFVYTPVTRARTPLGVAAVRLENGTIAWRAAPPEGGAAPPTVIPGVLFFGSSTGMVYAYATDDGHAIWEFDTSREFETVNGVRARGGSITSAGPIVAAGMLFVASGYSELGNGTRGNVLLAFGPR